MSTENVIDTLNDLIETCKDGEYGFRSCAEHIQSPEIRSLLIARAGDCQTAANELQSYVSQYGGEPEDGGSASGALHRGWVAVKGKLAGYTDLAMLEECERGEDVAKARYRSALKEDLPETIRAVIDRQYQGVVRNHDQIRELRERLRVLA